MDNYQNLVTFAYLPNLRIFIILHTTINDFSPKTLVMKNNRQHEYWMELALREASLSLRRKEVPIGALIVKDGMIIGKGSNQVEMLQDPTAHAEMIAITAAASHLESRRLQQCTMYVTLEPCPMCAGAIVLARIPVLIFGS